MTLSQDAEQCNSWQYAHLILNLPGPSLSSPVTMKELTVGTVPGLGLLVFSFTFERAISLISYALISDFTVLSISLICQTSSVALRATCNLISLGNLAIITSINKLPYCSAAIPSYATPRTLTLILSKTNLSCPVRPSCRIWSICAAIICRVLPNLSCRIFIAAS